MSHGTTHGSHDKGDGGHGSSPGAGPGATPTTAAGGSTNATPSGSSGGHQATPASTETTVTPASGSAVPKNAVTISVCKPYKWYWLLDGEIRNVLGSPHTFQFVVGFETAPGKIIDSRTVDTDVIAPGASEAWGASGAEFSDHVTCVVEQVLTTGPEG